MFTSVRECAESFCQIGYDFICLQITRQKFEARVPSLEVNISDKRLLLLASFLRNFPVPSSTSMATIGEDMVDGFPPLAPVFTFVSLKFLLYASRKE